MGLRRRKEKGEWWLAVFRTCWGGARWLKRWGWFCRQIVPQVEAGWWGREGG